MGLSFLHLSTRSETMASIIVGPDICRSVPQKIVQIAKSHSHPSHDWHESRARTIPQSIIANNSQTLGMVLIFIKHWRMATISHWCVINYHVHTIGVAQSCQLKLCNMRDILKSTLLCHRFIYYNRHFRSIVKNWWQTFKPSRIQRWHAHTRPLEM